MKLSALLFINMKNIYIFNSKYKLGKSQEAKKVFFFFFFPPEPRRST